MAELKIIEGTYGFASVIYDTTLYNYLMTISTGDKVVYQSGNYTAIGLEFYQALGSYVSSIKATMLHNLTTGDTFNVEACVEQMKKFIQETTYTDLFVRNVMEETFNANTTSMIRLTPSGSAIYTAISTDGVTWNGQQQYYPYGNISVATSQRYANAFINVQVYNDDGSAGTCFELHAVSDTGHIILKRKNFTVEWERLFPEWLGNINPWSDRADPYSPGRTSTHGGGGRSFDDSSDPVDIPPVPVDPVLNSGFVSVYKMDTMKLMDLATFMWDTNLFDVNAWQKVMANPFDAIISLKYVPANPNTLPNPAPIKIGNVQTNVSAPVVSQQYVQIQCGTLDVEEYSGSYLDYSPYTKIEIYLPFIGFRELNTDEVMDKTLTLTYNVDVLSGSCVANIKVGDTVLYQFAGECAMDIPITGRDSGKTLSGILGVITSAGSAVGGAIAGVLNPESAVKGVTAAAESVIGGKRNIQRSGNVTGSAGFMGGQTPYLIITRPRQALPEEQNLYMGYPSFITSLLGDLSGMTVVADCHLENIPCTNGELQEIERLLKDGVIL